jgi:dihydrofolate reductase
MANYIYVATSLDGYIATVDGGVEWLHEEPNPEGSDFGYAEFMQKIDALVMGRNTFEVVQGFGKWPYDKPVFVLSNTLTELPAEFQDRVEIVKGDIRQLVADLNERGYQNLYIDGGKVVQAFLAADLIDEMIIAKIPVLLGDGIPLFGKLEQSMKFSHKETKVFNDALVMSSYLRKA